MARAFDVVSTKPLITRIAKSVERELLWLLTAVYLIPIWWFRFLPTVDGPAHLNTAVVLIVSADVKVRVFAGERVRD